MQQSGADGAAEHDNESGTIDQGTELEPFQEVAEKKGAGADQNAYDA